MSDIKIEKSYDYADGKCTPFIKVILEPCHPDDNEAWNSRDELAKKILDLTAAQSELTALREELASARRDVERYQKLRKVTPYHFKKMQDASVTDGGDVLYFHSDRFDALVDADLLKSEQSGVIE